ncbi:protein sel-1 homolog 3 isoform X2 [Sphaeramia orbicularis]|uniref:protein sel-1 homolog 3 isoform X2 n=1 Tax=Sphaeramia orbicularis TaxID=375764 RepID=UPI00117DDCEC|nr:protein sel-1 homolog 3-like isoform X2 [Sphaeramia orbicularis]
MDFNSLYTYVCQFFLCMQIIWALDRVTLLNPPEEPVPDHLLKILYSCDEPATVELDSVVYFETGTMSTFLLRQWRCIPGEPRIRTLKLILPDWLVYQADGIVPDSQWVLSCLLRVMVRYSGFGDAEWAIAARDVASLEPKPSFSRPVKQHQLCFSWSSQMVRLTPKFLRKICPVEQETVNLLSSVFASSGGSFGITKTLVPFNNEVLEYFRVEGISFPWCMFSMWIFVTKHCQERLCGVFYHIDSHNNYATPAVFLTYSGKLHVQVTGESGDSSAFLSPFKVPLNEWCQLRVTFQGRTVAVSIVCTEKEQRKFEPSEYTFRFTPVLDDTDGYFVVGGGRYIRGVEGYFGPLVHYRNRIPAHSMSEAAVPDVIKNVNLTGWLQTCQQFSLELRMKINGYLLKDKQRAESESCFNTFYKWTHMDRIPSDSQCELWEASASHRNQAAKLAKLLVLKYGETGVSLPAVGRALYQLSLHKLGRGSTSGVVSRILPLLLQAGCLADNRALHMSAVFYSAGLGVRKQPNKAWLLSLLAAQKDYRLSLLHLGHMHHQGLHGVGTDPDLAYAYYANIAKQTTIDRHKPSPEQTFVEAIYLNNEEVLNQQTNEEHHIFQWLKLQARRGAADAEQSIARMLFWGQQGVSPNIQKAVRHYERGAVELEDPVSMYDYGIVLLQGHGVEQDIPKAITFLKKAMDQGFAPAISALAWYYEQFEQNYEKAVELWEQADLLENPEAALNLGVMYSQGLYPGKAADQYLAYQYYLKSARRGHIRGAVLVADIWIIGIPGRVNRRPLDAMLWVKWAAEHNGYLGSILRKGLESYLKSDMFNSLLFYMMAAESGYAAAQFNVAYLCEQNMGNFLDPAFALHCVWEYYNRTIHSQNPDTYALIKMGDLMFEGQGRGWKDLFSAAQMYKEAALRNDPQGWYSLGLLVEEGYKLPMLIFTELGLSDLYLQENSLLLNALYKSLALFRVYLQSFLKDNSAAIMYSTAFVVAAAPTIFFIILDLFRGHVFSFS